MGTKARNPVKSAERTFEIVAALRDIDGAGVTELAEYLGLPKSTVHSYLSTLEQEEWVVKEDGTYHIGLRFLEYGAHARRRTDLFKIAKPEVDRLADETGDLSSLLIEEHGRGVYIHRAEGTRAPVVHPTVGTRVHLHCTALGKAILAHLPDERVGEILETHGLPRMTPNTITDRGAFEGELAATRDRGHSVDDQEFVEGVRCVGAPILSKDGQVLGAISVSGPMNRFRGEYFDERLVNAVREAANVIELNITYS